MSTAVLALSALTLLAAAGACVRRIPPGQAYALRSRRGRTRTLAAGLHLVVPMFECVAHRMSLTGASVSIDTASPGGRTAHARVFFQIVDATRAAQVFEQLDALIRSAACRWIADAGLPQDRRARERWLKQSLNADVRDHGLIIARVDLAPPA